MLKRTPSCGQHRRTWDTGRQGHRKTSDEAQTGGCKQCKDIHRLAFTFPLSRAFENSTPLPRFLVTPYLLTEVVAATVQDPGEPTSYETSPRRPDILGTTTCITLMRSVPTTLPSSRQSARPVFRPRSTASKVGIVKMPGVGFCLPRVAGPVPRPGSGSARERHPRWKGRCRRPGEGESQRSRAI